MKKLILTMKDGSKLQVSVVEELFSNMDGHDAIVSDDFGNMFCLCGYFGEEEPVFWFAPISKQADQGWDDVFWDDAFRLNVIGPTEGAVAGVVEVEEEITR